MWRNPTAFWRSCGNGSFKQVLSSRNSGNPFVGNVMAGILAPVTASRTIGSSSGPLGSKAGITRIEQMSSAVHPITDVGQQQTSNRAANRPDRAIYGGGFFVFTHFHNPPLPPPPYRPGATHLVTQT